MLQNRIYRGEIVHQDIAYPGRHEAIIDLLVVRFNQFEMI